MNHESRVYALLATISAALLLACGPQATKEGTTSAGVACGAGTDSADCNHPSTPTNLAWTNAGGTVTLSWGASTIEDAWDTIVYELYFGSFYLGAFDQTSVDLIGFKPGTPYTFSVKARDMVGMESSASNTVTVLLPVPRDTTPPTAPTNLAVMTVTSTTVGLQWTASTDDVGVVVYQVFVNGMAARTVPGTSATVAGLTPRTVYSITVRALDAAGNLSGASSPVQVDTYSSCALGCSGTSSAP